MKFLKIVFLGLIVAIVIAVAWLFFFPPDLLRVGSNYSAKIICSNAFLANRDPHEVLQVDVQAPGHPMLSVMQVEIDRGKAAAGDGGDGGGSGDVGNNDGVSKSGGIVRAGLFGWIGQGLAVYRPGFGCTSVPDGALDAVTAVPSPPPRATLDKRTEWPQGQLVNVSTNNRLSAVLEDEKLAGPGMRAIVVVKGGKIVGEHYAAGFSSKTPLLGWSMAKTVTAGLVGTMVQENLLNLEDDQLFDHWSQDMRHRIRLSDLLGMASDLQWNESYGTVSDVTRLLFLESDMAAAATQFALNDPSGDAIGTDFNYSSGTSVVVTRFLQNLQPDVDAGLLLANSHLFTPLGMTSAVIEPDARGTLIGSSFMYANARDWARYAQFLLQDGQWQGQQLLPPGYVSWMRQPHPAHKDGYYGRGHVWLTPPGSSRFGPKPEFKHNAFWFAGHDGQSIAVLPDKDIIVVRLGLTPSKLGYKVARLVNAVVDALE